MHVTLLQPLLLLAAIAIVGAVPLLGVAVPVPTVGASHALAHRTEGGALAGQSRTSVRVGVRATREGAPCPPRVDTLGDAAPSVQRCWAVRRGTCVLPPPRA